MTLTSGASAAGLARGHDAVALRHLAGRYPSEPAGWQAVGLTVEPKVLQALARARFQRHCPYLPSPRSAPSATGTCQGVLAVGPLELAALSATDVAIGFSIRTCFPASKQARLAA
jgi:hypothetical protein